MPREAEDLTVLELPAGGYYLVSGAGHDLAAMQAEHGARSGWQVTKCGEGVRVSGRSAAGCCMVRKDRAGGAMVSVLRDAPSYLLV